MELRRVSKSPSACCDQLLRHTPACCLCVIELFGLILQLVELALTTVDPHEENGSEHRQNKGDDCIQGLSSNP